MARFGSARLRRGCRCVLIASLVVDQNEDGQGFGADHAWFYVALLRIGYLVSCGLAKSGSRDHEDSDS